MTQFTAPCSIEGCKKIATYEDRFTSYSLCEEHRCLEEFFARLHAAEKSSSSEWKLLAEFVMDIIDDRDEDHESLGDNLQLISTSLETIQEAASHLRHELDLAIGRLEPKEKK
jgi:hypothetical protein